MSFVATIVSTSDIRYLCLFLINAIACIKNKWSWRELGEGLNHAIA